MSRVGKLPVKIPEKVSAAHELEVFRTFYGPMHRAFGALDAAKQDALAADLIDPGRTIQSRDRWHAGGSE